MYKFQGRQRYKLFRIFKLMFLNNSFNTFFSSTNDKIWKAKLTEKCFSLKLYFFKYRITKKISILFMQIKLPYPNNTEESTMYHNLWT